MVGAGTQGFAFLVAVLRLRLQSTIHIRLSGLPNSAPTGTDHQWLPAIAVRHGFTCAMVLAKPRSLASLASPGLDLSDYPCWVCNSRAAGNEIRTATGGLTHPFHRASARSTPGAASLLGGATRRGRNVGRKLAGQVPFV